MTIFSVCPQKVEREALMKTLVLLAGGPIHPCTSFDIDHAHKHLVSKHDDELQGTKTVSP